MFRSIGSGLVWLSVLAACAATGSDPIPTRTPLPVPTPLPPPLIVTLGDSLTFGDKDDSTEGGGWPRRLQLLVQPRAQIVNLAQPGWTSHDLLQGSEGVSNQIDEAVRALRAAPGEKIATVWIGTNDLFYLYEFGDPTSAEEAQEANRFGRDLEEVVRRLTETGARVFIALLHDPSQGPVQSSGVFMSTAAEEWARMSQQARRYNGIIRIAAAQYGAALVDIPATQIFTTPALMYEDGIHPNARGYDELAKVWWNALTR